MNDFEIESEQVNDGTRMIELYAKIITKNV